MTTVTVKVKAEVYTITIDQCPVTVGTIKDGIAKSLDVPPGQQRLVLNGKILSNTDDVVDPDVLARSQIHLVKTAPKTAPTSAVNESRKPPSVPVSDTSAVPSFPGLPAGSMGDMMDMVSKMMGGGQAPSLGSLFSDPKMKDTIQEASRVAQEHLVKNPNLMSEMFSNSDFQSVVKNLVGETDANSSEFGDFMNDMAKNITTDPSIGEFLNSTDLVEEIAKTVPKSDAATKEFPNVDFAHTMTDMLKSPGIDDLIKNIMGSMTGDGGLPNILAGMTGMPNGSQPPATPKEDPKPKAATPATGTGSVDGTHLEMLSDLGFTDVQRNIEILNNNDGDVNKAIRELLNQEQ